MEETQSHCQSPSVWGSTQDLASWHINDDGQGKVRDQPSTTQEELANDLKAVGTTVTKKTISNTLHREGLNSCCACEVPLLKKAHVQAHQKFAKEHLDDPEETWDKVMWSVETKIELFGSTSRLEEEKCGVQPQEHHSHCEAWRWKPYALGVFLS